MTPYLRAAILFGAIASVTLWTGTAPAMAQDAGAGKPSDKSRKPARSYRCCERPGQSRSGRAHHRGAQNHGDLLQKYHPPTQPGAYTIYWCVRRDSHQSARLFDGRQSNRCAPGLVQSGHRTDAGCQRGRLRISIGFSDISEPVTGSNFVALLSSAAPEKTLIAG